MANLVVLAVLLIVVAGGRDETLLTTRSGPSTTAEPSTSQPATTEAPPTSEGTDPVTVPDSVVNPAPEAAAPPAQGEAGDSATTVPPGQCQAAAAQPRRRPGELQLVQVMSNLPASPVRLTVHEDHDRLVTATTDGSGTAVVRFRVGDSSGPAW